ncbi:uncharacterized protein [Epargyreus clarus]|uniref:uncharacterized protein n=1 Tax=Epargyreus clarus TaxID=520877 RepID=UPI003C2B3C1F
MIWRLLVIELFMHIVLISQISSKKRYYGPGGLEEHETTTCEQFSQNARFNPFSVLDSEWMVFYYWGPPQSPIYYKFYIPGEERVQYLKNKLEGHVKKPINWTSKFVLMREKHDITTLLVERSDRGEYDLYVPYKGLKSGDIIDPVDVRFKQTGDNKYLGVMLCHTDMVYVMARIEDVPPKNKIQDAAAKIGYRGRGGKSYLYQGHQWVPIPEADERTFWKPAKYKPCDA